MEQPAKQKLWNRDFTILWAGLVQSYLGDAFLNIGLMWLVLQMTGSAAAAATVLALGGLPKLLGPLTGVLVDRMSKRKLMIGSDLIRGVLLIAVYLLYLGGYLEVWHLYSLVVVLSVLAIIYSPALRVMLPALVPDESLPAANSSLQASLQIATIVGVSVAGVALAAFGAPVALLVDGVTFLLAAVALMFVRFPEELTRTAGLEVSTIWKEMMGGLRFIATSQEVLMLTVLAFFLNLILSPINVIFPIFSEDVLGAGVTGFGFLAATISIGLFLGNVLVGFVGDRLHYARAIAVGLLGMTVALVGLSFAQSLIPALLVAAALGMMAPFIQVPAITRLQRTVPQSLQGRVFSSWEALVTLAIPIAAAVAGRALMTFPVPPIFRAAAACIFVVAVLWVLLSTRYQQQHQAEPLESV